MGDPLSVFEFLHALLNLFEHIEPLGEFIQIDVIDIARKCFEHCLNFAFIHDLTFQSR